MPIMPNCDWGRPCECSECRTDLEERTAKICAACDADLNGSGVERYYETDYSVDRKGIGGYYARYYCKNCHAKNVERREEQERIREKFRKEEQNMKIANEREFLAHLEYVERFKPPGPDDGRPAPVPIKYLCEKLNVSAEYMTWKREFFARYFGVRKIRGRYRCEKYIADNVDPKVFEKYISNKKLTFSFDPRFDKTIFRREHTALLRKELIRRRKNGERNIVIKYTDGEPKIVSSSNT